MKFLDLFESLENVGKWCDTATQHLNREQDMDRGDQDVFSKIRQIDYLLSKSRELKIKSRLDFEDDFDDIKDFISAKIMFSVDDHLKQLEEVKMKVIERREGLRGRCPSGMRSQLSAEENCDNMSVRRENIITEMIDT